MKKARRRLNADELSALAAKTGISEHALRVLNTLRPNPHPSEAEQEELEYIESDLAEDRKPFDDVCLEHNLLNRLNSKERKLLSVTWKAVQSLKLVLDVPKEWQLPETAITRQEVFIVKTRKKLLRSKGWKALPEEIARNVERRLFRLEAEH